MGQDEDSNGEDDLSDTTKPEPTESGTSTTSEVGPIENNVPPTSSRNVKTTWYDRIAPGGSHHHRYNLILYSFFVVGFFVFLFWFIALVLFSSN